MKRLVSGLAVVLAVVVLAVPASAETPPYSWSHFGQTDGHDATGGSHTATWSYDTMAGRLSIDAVASEPGTHTFMTPSAWAWVNFEQYSEASVTPGSYRVTVRLSDVDATVDGELFGTASLEADLRVDCLACGDDGDYQDILATDNLHRSVTITDGVVELTEDIDVTWTGTVGFSISFIADAITTRYATPAAPHGGTATVDFDATIESMTVTPL